MREILFRGKRLDNGEWVEGNLFIPDKVTRTDVPTEILVGTNIVRISFEVDPSTIGQYTGMTDKNGVKIFEGDIVRRKDKSVWEIAFIENITRFAPRKPGIVFAMFQMMETEVVGNIHDNPELLKGGDTDG